jgi:GTP diphosphokinase / guanosine-3',5'-bis(diphosphate) 3'-diphosphatase
MNTPQPTVTDILDSMEGVSSKEKDLLTRAYAFSEKVHSTHTRYSGEPFFAHPATVALYLAEMGMDAHTICAGLLHDSIEDVGVTPEEMIEQFGTETYTLVDGVTKLGKVRFQGTTRHTESLRKLFAATAKDVRVILIKLADRLHNARTLEFVPKHKQTRIALETLEVYAPIADRLGMSIMKKDLEDAAFPFAYPEDFAYISHTFKDKYDDAKDQIEKMETAVRKIMLDGGVKNFRLHSRVKGLYSLFKKFERKGKDVDKIYDLIALRIVVDDLSACYQTLGLIHGNWLPLPGKLKDYIAFPKPNGYQSIHTTVHTRNNSLMEVQIRTEDMHKEAEYGLAAHLSYKDATTRARGKKGGKQGNKARQSDSMKWMRQFFPAGLVDPLQITGVAGTTEPLEYTDAGEEMAPVPYWIRHIAENHTDTGGISRTEAEYTDDLKDDFFSHRIFIFTPKGDVVDLPAGACAIDFAYTIHSDLGEHISGARVNGKMTGINEPLHNGDIVEVLTNKDAKPSKKWLEFVKSSIARKHIRAATYGTEKKERKNTLPKRT